METEQVFKAEGMHALVVDDNEVNSMVVASMLEQFSIAVTEVYSGKDAIEKVKYQDYDIIFMDYLMPEMNGMEATEEIRKLGKVKRPVIVALSADDTQELKAKFAKVGVDDVLAKPLELDMLCQILKKWIPEDQVSTIDVNLHDVDTTEGLLDIFSHVEGLDVEKGLSHLGNSTENYIKVIEAAVDNIRTERNRLAVYLESQVQPSSMKISFHSLKGVFLNLGAQRLSEQAQLFELACTNTTVDLLADNLEQFLKEMEQFYEGLEQGLVEYDDSYVKRQEERYFPLAEEEFKETLERLIYCLKRYEYNDLGELLQRLIYATTGEEKSKYISVGKAIQNFQYEEALQLLGISETEEETE